MERSEGRYTECKGSGNAQLQRSREYYITVASWAGTYRIRVIKHDDAFVEHMQHGSVPVLQCCQVHHNSRYFRDAVQQ